MACFSTAGTRPGTRTPSYRGLNYFGNFKIHLIQHDYQLLNLVNKMIKYSIQVKLTPSWYFVVEAN